MAADGIRLIQISDCHLLADPAERLRGVDTDATLAAVIARVRDDAPELVLATGDLSQDGSAASYRRVKALFGRLGAPVYCLPGNHDDAGVLAETMPGDGIHVIRSLRRDGWQIVFLDSTVAGQDDGHLPTAELAALDAALAACRERHALVCLHHHPVAVGGAWTDFVSLANPEDLFAVLDRHPQVRGLVWGHIHQPFEGARSGVRLFGAPATCFQFARDAADALAVADEPPAYRRFTLHADGAIDSAVRWLDAGAPGDS
ncbi:MAG: phosphodiesterase [Alphaproteobacteria bacterium]